MLFNRGIELDIGEQKGTRGTFDLEKKGGVTETISKSKGGGGNSTPKG